MSEPRRRADARGRGAERLCAWALRLKGYRVVARRFRGPGGEVDIIARRGSVLAAIEVKARRSLSSGLESVTPRQRARIERAALSWLAAHPDGFLPERGDTLRFDVMVVRPWRWPHHVAGAWQPDGAVARGW